MDIPPKENKEEERIESLNELLIGTPADKNCRILSNIKNKEDLIKEINRLNKIIDEGKEEDKYENIHNLFWLNQEKFILENKKENIIDHPVYFYKEPIDHKTKRIERERSYKEYNDNYVPNFSDMGFNIGVLKKPKKTKIHESDEEGLKIEKTNFNYKEFMEDAIDDNGNIKNGGSSFNEYFFKKVSPVLGKDLTKYYIDVDEYTNWKGEEIQNDLCEFINDDKIDKKDIEKIVAVKLIHDMIYYLADYDGFAKAGSFVSDSLINRIKNNNVTILEKSFIKKNIYDIFDLEKDNPGRYSISGRYEKEEKDFLEKEIGVYYSPEDSHDKSFNSFSFSFNENQIKAIEYPVYDFDSNGEIKPVNYYENNNIERPTSYKIGKNGIEGFINECYITSYVAPGIVGIYSNDGTLIGWKNVIDLKEDEFNSINDVSEINRNNQISKDDLALFRVSSSLSFRYDIQNMLNVDLSKISLGNQFYFLNFIQGKTENDLIGFKEFIKKSNNEEEKINKLKTFLSIEQGGKEMGDKIIGLGEKLPEDVAKKVFTKYGEIIDNVSKITEFARNNFTKEIETDSELIKKIEETLYIKGKQLLSQAYDDISNKKEVNYEDIGKQLDRINADTITTFAIFKQAVKNGEKLPIESIEGSVFSKKEASDISDNQQHEMLELYESNWKNHPDRDFVESLKSYFKTSFVPEDNKQKNYFYTFEKDNNIRAFVRFEKQNDASFYASALNVDEASKNFGLGEAMMDEALTREAKEHILHASCRKDNESNMRYFEKGFISRGFKKTNETEEFDLIWDENKNKYILAKQKSQEELINMENTEDIEIRKSKNLESLHTEIPEGKSLVRCFINNGEWYAVYEKVKDDYGMNLGETK